MATYTFNSTTSNYFSLTLEVDLVSQSTANNTSTINWELLLNVGAASFNYYTLSNTLTWVDIDTTDSKEWVWPTGDQFSCSGTNKTVSVSSGTKTIQHASDGSKAINVSASFRTSSITAYTPQKALTITNQSITLPTIARASQPSPSASSVELVNSITINTNRADTSFTHTLKYVVNSQLVATHTSIDVSDRWTLPITIADHITTSTSATMTVTCETYSGGVLIGTKTTTFTVTIPSSVVPSITNKSAVEYITNINTKFGSLIQNRSKLQLSMETATQYNATVANITMTANGQTFTSASATSTSAITDFLKTAGTNTITFKVTDSRGRTATSTLTVTVVAYSPPRITSFNVERCDSDGAYNPSGGYAHAIYSASITPINGNDKSFILQKRVSGTTAWIPALTLSSASYSYTNTTSIPTSADTNKNYDFRIVVEDYFTDSNAEFPISSAFATVHFRKGGRGVGVGMITTKDAFQVGMPIDIIGDNVSTGRRCANRAPATVTDPNTVTQEWVLIDGHANLPAGGGYWYLHTIFYSTASYKLQLAYGYNTGEIYKRHCYDGTWTQWNRVFSTASLDLSALIRTTGSQSRTGGLSVTGTDTSGSYGSAPIQIREVNNVGAAQYADNYAPYLSFHWGGRLAGAIMMSASGDICWRNQDNTIVSRIYHEGMSRSQTLYYPTFTTGWTNWGNGYQPVSYYKDAFNIIHLQGMAQSTSTAQYVFTLPAGWRPAYNHAYTVNYNNAQSNLYITSAGVVHHANASTSAGKWLSLDGICFEKGA